MSSQSDIDVSTLGEIREFKLLADERMAPDVLQIFQNPHRGAAIRSNLQAWQRWALQPRAMVPLKSCDTSTTVLGEPVDAPILVAPFALQGFACDEGDVATAEASRDSGTLMAVSMTAVRTPEEIAATGARFWMQLDWIQDRGRLKEIVEMAVQAGAKAICLTVDMPVFPWWTPAMREALNRMELESTRFIDAGRETSAFLGTAWAGNADPSATGLGLATHEFVRTPGWEELEWLGSLSPLPLIVKGVLNAEDAKRAVGYGASAVVVSNHGGDGLEQSLGTAEVLPDVVKAVGDQVEVLVDGGIRSGADVLRALALGAGGVLVGRTAYWGLTVGGAAGVSRVLTLLQEELQTLMGYVGAESLADIHAGSIVERSYVDPSFVPDWA
jgi:4-hydroxymandelate oxidase